MVKVTAADATTATVGNSTTTAGNSDVRASVADTKGAVAQSRELSAGEQVAEDCSSSSSSYSSIHMQVCRLVRASASHTNGTTVATNSTSTVRERGRIGESVHNDNGDDDNSGGGGTAASTGGVTSTGVNGVGVGLLGDSRFDFSSTTHSHVSRSMQHQCRVCFSESCLDDDTSAADLRTCNFCEDRTCVSCFSAWIKAQVNMGKAEITCPSCDVAIPPCDLTEFVTPETLRKLEYYKSRREHNRNPHAVWCAESTCRELLTTTPPTDKKNGSRYRKKNGVNGDNIECARCSGKTCRKCHNLAHEGVRCKKPRMTHYNSVKNVFWKRFHARKCPECHVWIEKDGGCSEMECTHCNMNFCFRCGTSYYRINLAGRSIDGCRCIRMRKNTLRAARAGVFAISFPFLVVALGIGIPAAALLYYASSNDKREVADRVFEEFFKHYNTTSTGYDDDSNSFRNHIQHLVDRTLTDGSTTTTTTDSDLYSRGHSDSISEDGNGNAFTTEVAAAPVTEEEDIVEALEMGPGGVFKNEKGTTGAWNRKKGNMR